MTTTDRYPDLSGKVAIVAGTRVDVVLDVVRMFVANHVPVAVVAPDREAMRTATELFSNDTVNGVAVTGDPSDTELWQRVAPHTEQRLGPIDIVVLTGDASMHDVVVNALLPDMAARQRGVVIEIGDGLATRDVPAGVHHYVATTTAEVVAAAATGSK